MDIKAGIGRQFFKSIRDDKRNNMKILYVITKSEVGGAQVHILELIKYFREDNQIALMSYPGGWLEKECRKLEIKFYPNRFLTNSLNIKENIKAFFLIKKAIKDFNPDLISSHSSKAGYLTRFAARKRCNIFTAHGWVFSQGGLSKHVHIFFERIFSKFCQKIICVSNFDKGLALKYSVCDEEKLEVIYNGVETSENSIKKTEDPLKIIYVARLCPPKDPFMFLKALIGVENIKVKIAGDGVYKKRMQETAFKNNLDIEFLGEISREEADCLIKESDVLVLTSKKEGFPLSVLEALRHGLLVIANDVGGVGEAVKDCGILVKNEDELRSAFKKITEDKNLVERYKKKAKEKSYDFSLKSNLLKHKRLYESLFSKK